MADVQQPVGQFNNPVPSAIDPETFRQGIQQQVSPEQLAQQEQQQALQLRQEIEGLNRLSQAITGRQHPPIRQIANDPGVGGMQLSQPGMYSLGRHAINNSINAMGEPSQLNARNMVANVNPIIQQTGAQIKQLMDTVPPLQQKQMLRQPSYFLEGVPNDFKVNYLNILQQRQRQNSFYSFV